MRLRDIVRGSLSMVFFSGAAANLFIYLANAQLYKGFADLAFLALYRELWSQVVFPRMGWFLAGVILLELGIAYALTRSGKIVQMGLAAAALFMAGLVPFWWNGGALGNVVIGLLCVWLFVYRYERPLWRWSGR